MPVAPPTQSTQDSPRLRWLQMLVVAILALGMHSPVDAAPESIGSVGATHRVNIRACAHGPDRIRGGVYRAVHAERENRHDKHLQPPQSGRVLGGLGWRSHRHVMPHLRTYADFIVTS